MFFNRKNFFYQNYPHLTPYSEAQIRQYRQNALLAQAKLQAYRDALLEAHAAQVRAKDGVSFIGSTRVDSPTPGAPSTPLPPKQQEFIPYGYVSRPGSTPHSYSLWGGSADSASDSASSHEKRFGQTLCRILSVCAVLLVILSVLGIVGIAVYLGYIKVDKDTSLASNDTDNFVGTLRIIQGDSWVPDLSFPDSPPFRAKATKYSNMFKNVFKNSILGGALSDAEILQFARLPNGGIFEISFRLPLDRRKLPWHLPNTEVVVREVLEQEFTSVSPVAFDSVKVDINSFQISREVKPSDLEYYPLREGETAQKDFKVVPVKGAEVVIKKRPPSERLILKGHVLNVDHENRRQILLNKAGQMHPPQIKRPTTASSTSSTTTTTTTTRTTSAHSTTTPSTTATTTIKSTTPAATTSSTTTTTTSSAPPSTPSRTTIKVPITSPSASLSSIGNLIYESGNWRPLHPNEVKDTTEPSNSDTLGKTSNVQRFLELLAHIASFRNPPFNPIQIVKAPSNLSTPSDLHPSNREDHTSTTQFTLLHDAPATQVSSTTTEKFLPKPEVVFPYIFHKITTTEVPPTAKPESVFPVFYFESTSSPKPPPEVKYYSDLQFPFYYQESTTTQKPIDKFLNETFATRVGSPSVDPSKVRNEVKDPPKIPPSKLDIKNILAHLLFLPTVRPLTEKVTPAPNLKLDDADRLPESKSEFREIIDSSSEHSKEHKVDDASRPPISSVTSHSGVRDFKRPFRKEGFPLDRFRFQANDKSTPLTHVFTPGSTKFSLWNLLTTNKPLILDTEVVTSTSYDIKYGTTSHNKPNSFVSMKNEGIHQHSIPVLSKDKNVRYITVNRTRNIYPKVVIVNLPESSRESKSNDPNKGNLEDIFLFLKEMVKNEELEEEDSQTDGISLWTVLSNLGNLKPVQSSSPTNTEEFNLLSATDPLPSSYAAFFKELLHPQYSNSYSKINFQSDKSPSTKNKKSGKSLSYDDITALFVMNDPEKRESRIYSITGKSPDLPKNEKSLNSPIHIFTFKEGQSLNELLEEIFSTISKPGSKDPDFRADSFVSSNKAIGVPSARPPPMGEDALTLIESISKILTGNYVHFNMLLEEADSQNELNKASKLKKQELGQSDLAQTNEFITAPLTEGNKNKTKIDQPKYDQFDLFPVLTRPLNPISSTSPATLIDPNLNDSISDNNYGLTTQSPVKIVTTVEVSYSVHSSHSNYSLPIINENKKECPENGFRCGNGKCVSIFARCNLVRDCEDGSDERPCTCADFLRSQHYTRKICDGIIDCWDKSDEMNCDWCYPSHFICAGVQKCVPPDNVCDGYPDCPNGDDERSCVTIAPNQLSANSLDYFDEGYLMVRRKGVWGKLCVENFESSVAKAGVSWSVADLGEAVCSTLTFDSFDHIHREVDNVPPTSRSAEIPYYEIDITNDQIYPPRGRHYSTNPRGRISKRSLGVPSANLDIFQHFLVSASANNKIGHTLTRRDVSHAPEGLSLQFKQARCTRRDVIKVKCDGLQCGIRPRATTQQARIVGGNNSSPGAWPWHAALYKEGAYQCGATLINENYLLSAGHCFYGAKSEYWVARLGALRRGSRFSSPFEQIKTISHIFIHPDYVNKGYINDISVLKVKEPVQFNDYVRPVCLPSPGSDITHGERCTLVGWGQLYEVKKVFPDTLQEVEVPLISTKECRKQTVFLPLYRITEDMFCAGYDRGGRDACLGDSGGPLMCQKTDGSWVAMGVTSNGYGCARAGRPGVYTKIANYLSWIEHVQRLSNSDLVIPFREKCEGMRCALGDCLPKESICNARVECSDGSDEEGCDDL